MPRRSLDSDEGVHMFGKKDRHDDAPARVDRDVHRDVHPYGTSTDADVTARMAGTGSARHARTPDDQGPVATDTDRGVVTDTSRPAERTPDRVLRARTSAAATFALVFGLAALFCGLTGILAPAAVLFGLIGVALGLVGRRKGLLPGITGRGVATGGLVTSVLGLLLGLAVIAGLAVYVNQQGLDGLQERIDNARDSLPTGQDVVDTVPGS
jgi:hypothetical protein